MNDVAGFEENCLPHRPDLLEFAHKLTKGDRDSAEDIVQSSLTKAWVAWERFRTDGDPYTAARGWLYRIVSNTFAKDYHYARRRRGHTRDRAEDVLEGSFGGVVVDRVSHAIGGIAPGADQDRRYGLVASPASVEPPHEFGPQVLAAIAELEPDHREVLHRHYVLEQPYEEIAAALGIRKGTVCSRLARARRHLKETLREYVRECGLRTLPPGDDADGDEAGEVVQSDSDGVDGVVARDDGRELFVA